MTDFAAPIHRRLAVRTRQQGAEVAARDDWRLMLMILAFALFYGAVGVRMGLMALSEPEEPSLGAIGTAEPVRGMIADRNGRLLAANMPAWSLYAHPREIKNPQVVARELAGIFGSDKEAAFLKQLTSRNSFVWIERPITPRQKAAVQDLGRPGLLFGPRDLRFYPAGRVTAHLVGSVSAATEDVRFAELVGAGGAERYFQDRLSDPARAGEPLALSIDLAAQTAMRDVLSDAKDRFGAKGAVGIVMDVNTGEIMTMVSLPDYDPHAPRVRRDTAGGKSPRFNRAVQGLYELGSVSKVITAAIALDLGLAHPQTRLKTGRPIPVGGRLIRDYHALPDTMSLTDVVVRSSNVGTVRLVQRIGTTRFKEYLGRLGLFEPTSLELSEARSARPLIPRRWREISSYTISFGHGMSISPLHLVAAYATIANGGRRIQPTLTRGGGEPGERVFSERTAQQMLYMLREVVERGTGRRTNVEGYEVGGKTGTADKVREDGRGYHKNRVISSFASVFPVSNPRYAMLISLDEPTDRSGSRPIREASRTAVPTTAEAIRRIAPLLGLRPPVGAVEPDLAVVSEAGTRVGE